MTNKKAFDSMIEKTDGVGWLHFVGSRSVMAKDVEGLKKILAENPRICWIRIKPAPMGFGHKEEFYTCDDTSISKEGRASLEDGTQYDLA